ncbi:MAG: XRE family transcriptional regulator [Proteobacteria bacterium]|jgi:transcriptional regulator with XRE-family HTH domain|nr:XRE family transcriptional regulator [Pseudomonadota bacterium]
MTNFLRKIRESKRIRQTELADQIGVSKQLLSGFENGRSGISNEVLQKLAIALDVSPDSILIGKSNRSFDEVGKKQLTEAMRITFNEYGDKLDKETIIKISTELYGMIFHNDFLISDLEKIKYQESLQEKIIAGLAAQCFLKIKN